MRRFIITGAPGAGKTSIVRQLELDGFSVVEEAATDVIVATHALVVPVLLSSLLSLKLLTGFSPVPQNLAG